MTKVAQLYDFCQFWEYPFCGMHMVFSAESTRDFQLFWLILSMVAGFCLGEQPIQVK